MIKKSKKISIVMLAITFFTLIWQTTFATSLAAKSDEHIADNILNYLEQTEITTNTTENKTKVTIPEINEEKNNTISEDIEQNLKIIEFISCVFICFMGILFL